MSMIVQTLTVLETDDEQSLKEVIAQKFEIRNSEEANTPVMIEE